MNHILFSLATILFLTVSLERAAMAAASNVNADATTECNSTSAMVATASACTATPVIFKSSIYEMGLCTSHPYGAAKTANTFNSPACIINYKDANPSVVDIATTLSGTPLSLAGTSTMPSEGSYSYAYIILGSSFTSKGTFTDTANTYYSTSSCTAVTGAGSYGECVDNLRNFNSSVATECDSGYVGATVSGGTIDGFVTDSSLVRSVETNGATSSVCDNSGRLVGVMTLSTPVEVTSKTYSVFFNFELTNYGVQFIETDGGGDTVPNEFGSSPFSGYFTILNTE